jgi:hypothetical protein
MENLASAGLLPGRDLELLYEGLFLSMFTKFESLLEELFFGLLVGRVSRQSCGASTRIVVKNDRVAREIVLRERKYIDWLPFYRTEEMARAFLSRGRPFTHLDETDKGTLTALLAIRHAIAHKSGHAKKAFQKRVIGATPLPPRERTPAGYLRSQFRISPTQTRFELHMQAFSKIVHKITHAEL